MPDARRRNCKVCGRHESECGAISWNGNCLDCAKALLVENTVGISTKTGFAYRRQLKGMARYVERAWLDVGVSTTQTGR